MASNKNRQFLDLTKLPAGLALANWNSELPASGTGDPLGMTLRVGARLGAELLHCITSITPRARYYSFYPWAFQRAHRRAGQGATFERAMRHVLIDERAMTLGAVLHHEGRSCEGGALQGSSRAIELATNPPARSVDLGKWSHLRDDTSGFGAYKGSLINLGVFEEETTLKEGADGGDEEAAADTSGRLSARGEALAAAFERAVAGTKFVSLTAERTPTALSVIEEFGAASGLCELRTADDFDLAPLRDLFFATDSADQQNSHFRRRMTLLLLLWAVETASEAGVSLNAQILEDLTFYRCIVSDDESDDQVPAEIEVPPALDDILERWRIFHFHNYLTTGLEALLAGLVRVIRNYPAGRSVSEILDAFDGPEARSDLQEYLSVGDPIAFMDITPAASLGLLGIDVPDVTGGTTDGGEVFHEMPFVERSLRSAITEDGYVSAPAGPAIAVLLVYSLLLRYEVSVREGYQGWNTRKVLHPLADVAMPTVDQSVRGDFGQDWWFQPNREIVARLLNRFVIRQHETMSYEKGFGGSPPLFRVDGAMIIGMDLVRDDVSPGNPRFWSAMQVLRDLRLIGRDGDDIETLTADGREMLTSFRSTADA